MTAVLQSGRPLLPFYQDRFSFDLRNQQLFRATSAAAGYDLLAAEDALIWPFQVKMIRTGMVTELPAGSAGLVLSRSSVGVKRRLVVAQGVGLIDPDYRKEWFVPLANLSFLPKRVKRGERIAQLLLVPALHPIVHECVDRAELSDTTREGGFGSTGR